MSYKKLKGSTLARYRGQAVTIIKLSENVSIVNLKGKRIKVATDSLRVF